MSAEPSNPTDQSVLSRASTVAQPEEPIVLVDHTQPSTDDELRQLDTQPSFQKISSNPLSLITTQGSLRQSIARRKYQRSRWQEGKGKAPVQEESEEASGDGQQEDPRSSSSQVQEEDTWGESRIDRGRRKVKNLVRSDKANKPLHNSGHRADTQMEILYENQRGFFFFGIPHFSSNSLLNFDPSAWLDANLKPSAVNITNAQVPDPSWEWAWRTWYVDMSHDVDEEGWEYSFWFGKGCAWHGTHPWFHSFVRRRRWLRMRVRKLGRMKGDTKFGEGHVLNADYFTIHSQPRPRSPASSIGTSDVRSPSKTEATWGAMSWEQAQEDVEVRDIPTLMKGLKKAAIDREKIVLIRKFLEQGGDELHYLAEQMPTIMSLLVFQNSRRQLLAIIIHRIDAAEAHRDEHQQRDEPEDDTEKRYIDNLLSAVKAADEQCKHLEYWSDVAYMAREGMVYGATDESHGWGHDWQGLDASGPGSTEPQSEDEDDSKHEKRLSKGKGRVGAEGEQELPGRWVDGAEEKEKEKSPSGAISIEGNSGDSPKETLHLGEHREESGLGKEASEEKEEPRPTEEEVPSEERQESPPPLEEEVPQSLDRHDEGQAGDAPETTGSLNTKDEEHHANSTDGTQEPDITAKSPPKPENEQERKEKNSGNELDEFGGVD